MSKTHGGRVLDASAVLAVLFEETGHGAVIGAIETGEAKMSAVNYAEVIGRMGSYGSSKEEAVQAVAALSIEIMSFGEDQAEIAGAMRPAALKHGLSLGDCACLALGTVLKLPVLTADRSWAKLTLENVKVELLR